MYKLKDIISSGGTNPKINKAIDRYELSKDEKKDIINTIKNTQQGGGDTPSGERNVEYLDFTTNPDNIAILEIMGGFISSARANVDGIEIIAGGIMVASAVDNLENNLKAVCIDKDLKFSRFGNGSYTIYTYETWTNTFPQELWDIYNSIPRMTEEEFYNLQ